MRTFWMILVILAAIAVLTIVAIRLFNQRTKSVGGLDEGHLKACPDSPNCVCSQFPSDSSHYIEPFSDPTGQNWEKLRQLLKCWPRTQLVVDEPSYMHATVHSAVFEFIDDVEFLKDPSQPLIQVRSAARVGYKDFGVNRKRVEEIRQAL